ncbi:MAG: dihydroorotate dehydrogenase electron transfer subunit [Myxococcota bacterium]|nr:dihydroorotate dehydrogenase electron transfer subunit [Myxococcota bacterium]
MLLPDPDGRTRDPLLPRPMAVFRGGPDALEFRFKVVGPGTALLSELREGEALGVLGPLGNGFSIPDRAATLVGGGTGIASLYELAREAPAGTRVLLGGRSRRELLALEEFRALPVEVEFSTDDGSLGHTGLVTDLLQPEPDSWVLACGPTPMMRRAAEIAAAAGARCRVSLENTMACGFGICLGCAVPLDCGFRYVCTHGPVFDAARLDWDGLP